jgi:hypothetical protein
MVMSWFQQTLSDDEEILADNPPQPGGDDDVDGTVSGSAPCLNLIPPIIPTSPDNLLKPVSSSSNPINPVKSIHSSTNPDNPVTFSYSSNNPGNPVTSSSSNSVKSGSSNLLAPGISSASPTRAYTMPSPLTFGAGGTSRSTLNVSRSIVPPPIPVTGKGVGLPTSSSLLVSRKNSQESSNMFTHRVNSAASHIVVPESFSILPPGFLGQLVDSGRGVATLPENAVRESETHTVQPIGSKSPYKDFTKLRTPNRERCRGSAEDSPSNAGSDTSSVASDDTSDSTGNGIHKDADDDTCDESVSDTESGTSSVEEECRARPDTHSVLRGIYNISILACLDRVDDIREQLAYLESKRCDALVCIDARQMLESDKIRARESVENKYNSILTTSLYALTQLDRINAQADSLLVLQQPPVGSLPPSRATLYPKRRYTNWLYFMNMGFVLAALGLSVSTLAVFE